jgi:hypothetical protein
MLARYLGASGSGGMGEGRCSSGSSSNWIRSSSGSVVIEIS